MAQNFSVYKSSAGSGKTTTLVREYLRLSLRDPESFHRIIALTFTNKATFEMKERVLETLKEIISSNPPYSQKLQGTFDYLVARLKLPEDKLIANAEVLLTKILHNYADFAFSTLDGFVVKIVKAFAFELKLPNAFDVELDSNILLTKAVDLLLEQVGSEKELTNYLVKYLGFLDEKEQQTSIEKNLLGFGKLLFQASHYKNIIEFEKKDLKDFNKARLQLEKKELEFKNQIIEVANACLELIHNNGLSAVHFAQGERGIYGFFVKAAKDATVNTNSYTAKAVLDDVWTSSKKEAYLSQIMSIKSKIIADYNQINYSFEQMKSCTVLVQTLVPTALLIIILKNIIAVSEGEGLVHLSEMNNRIQQLVENESSPFIYERIGQRINHFLVDEFQDTSKIQWQNLIPLLENSLSENRFNMLVGDAKQAIYRWREGDLQQFVNLPTLENTTNNSIIALREKTLKSQFEDLSLNNNYRSSDLIVNFNNKVLSRWIQQLDNSLIYKVYGPELNDIPIQKSNYGYVRVDFVSESKDETEEELILAEKVAFKVFTQIRIAQSHHFALSEIAVLARGKREIGFIAKELSKRNIPFVSADALQVSSSKSVQFVVAILNWLNNPMNQVNRLFIIQYLAQTRKQKIASKELKELINTTNSKFVNWVNSNHLNFDYYNAKHLNIYESVEYIIRCFDLYKNANQLISHFVDMVLKYSLIHGSNLSDFIDLWNEKLSNESVSGVNMQTEAVQLLTFHKAKGLEFKVVVNVLWKFKSPNSNNYGWVDVPQNFGLDFTTLPVKIGKTSLQNTLFYSLYEAENIETELDDLNIHYVALTRPKTESYIVLSKNEPNAKSINDKKSGKLFNQVVWDYVTDSSSGFIASNELSFELKQFEIPETYTEKVEVDCLKMSCIESNDWGEKLHLKQLSSINYFDEFEQKRQYGELLHSLLSKIDSLKDLDELINQAKLHLKQGDFVINQLKTHCKLLQQCEDLNPFFDSSKIVMKEAAILVKEAVFRPDRVVVDQNEIRILDYKVTSYGSVSESSLDKYKKQLNGYKNLLESMYSKKVTASLLFIGDSIDLIRVE